MTAGDYIKYGVIIAVVGAVYLVGYKHAETEGELAIEALKNEHAALIIDAQKKEQAKYEETIKSLTSALDRARTERDGRMHELENFRASATDNETCRRQRSRLARVAVGLEDVAKRAVLYIEGGTK